MHVTCPNCGSTVEHVEAAALEAMRCPDCGSTLRPGSEMTGSWIAGGSIRKPGPVEVGQTISHYRILERLGGGGMGVVYQAQDTRLGRRVAIKFLPEQHVEDRQALERFRREARTASELNHPHICTIYDIGEHEDQPFIVMELLDGQTLKSRIAGKPLPTDELLELGMQIADALDAAHAQGIVHRDIKPANLFVTRRGQAKVLDFGLAKLVAARQPGGARLASPGSPRLTEDEEGPLSSPGTVFGTIAYMSPEQARGQELDARTDLFSFGVVLYEMATGRRPFQGNTPALIFDAILNQTPLSPRHWNPSLPVELEHIIQKALEKDREVRYQTAAELRADLKRLKRDIDSGRVSAASSTMTAAVTPQRRYTRKAAIWAAVGAALALVIGGGIWWHSNRPSETIATAPLELSAESAPLPLRVVPFTSYLGGKGGPTFSPDGSRIAFNWDNNKLDGGRIYVKLVGGAGETQLTSGSGFHDFAAAWSPDNTQIAFLRLRDGKLSLCTVPALPGPEQVLVDDLGIANLINDHALYCSVSWSPKGNMLAFPYRKSPTDAAKICLFSVAERKILRDLTSPPLGIINGDGGPSISPDGKWLAFIRSTNWETHDLYVVPMSGGDPTRLTEKSQIIIGCTWTPDSREIVFASNRTGSMSLWRVPFTGGEPRALVGVGHNAVAPAISLRESRLAYVEYTPKNEKIWRMKVSGTAQERAPTRLTSSTRDETMPSYSPDGKKIVFESNRDGTWGIWICDSEGLNPVRLTTLFSGSASWSPNGQQIAFQGGQEGAVYIVSPQGGPPRRLTPPGCGIPSWSRDGEWVYFTRMEAAGLSPLWKMRARGGLPVQVTWGKDWVARESKDGKWLYYFRELPVPSVWKAPIMGAEEALPALGARVAGLIASPLGQGPFLAASAMAVCGGGKVLELRSSGFCWTLSETSKEQGIYFFDPQPGKPWVIKFFDLRTGDVRVIGETGKDAPVWAEFPAVSPDGQWLLYCQIEYQQADIMLVENFR